MRTVPDSAGPDQIVLDLDQVPSGRLDQRTEEILGLVAADPAHLDDVRRVVAAIRADAVGHGGDVDPNRVRKHLTTDRGDYTVTPQCVGAVYNSLRRKGLLTVTGWTINADGRGNSGKPLRTYRAEVAA